MVRTTVSILFILVFFMATPGASHHDTLPLGESKYRFELAKIGADQVFATRSGEVMDVAGLVDAAADSDVFVIGEFHDNMDCHLFQKRFIRALFEKHPRIVVGLEFFSRKDNPVLEKWRTGEIREDELLEQTGWYRRTALNYGYTRVVMDVIREYRIPVIGLNVSRDILRKVSRKGFQSLSPEEKKLFPGVDARNDQHRYLIKTVFGDFATQVPMWFENIYTAQKCWDVVMAESMRTTLAKPAFKGYRGIIIAGNFHVAYGLGIPFRYHRARKAVNLTIVVPVSLGSEDGESREEPNPMKKMFEKQLPETAVFSRGIADFVFSVSTPTHPHFPELGITCKKVDDRLQVTRVRKGAIAEEYGIQKGDVIISLDGVRVNSLEQFRRLGSRKNWDEKITMEIEKGITLRKKPDENGSQKTDSR